MKKANENANSCDTNRAKSRLKSLWDRQTHKIKNGKYKCPLCREVFTGLSEMGAHLKAHCT